jgi:hypothetical protein
MSEPLSRWRELRDLAAARLASRLEHDDAPLAELRELQERLSMLDATVADQMARAHRHRGMSVWPVLLVATVLLVAATVPVRSVPLSLEVRASAITFGLADESTLASQSVDGELRIDGFTSLESADAALVAAAAQERADRIAIRAAETRLRSLALPAGTQLTIRGRLDTTELQVESVRSPVVAEVEVRGHTTLRMGDGVPTPARAFPHGEWLRLNVGDAAHPKRVPPPMLVSLSRGNDSAPQFSGLRPATLRFAERREGAGAVAIVDSSIAGGTLTLPATSDQVTLSAGDWLEFDGLVVERCEVVAGVPMMLKLSGSARSARLRVGEFERSLKPSILEYVSRHHLVSLLWGSAAVLWGALAWIRRQFAGAPL